MCPTVTFVCSRSKNLGQRDRGGGGACTINCCTTGLGEGGGDNAWANKPSFIIHPRSRGYWITKVLLGWTGKGGGGGLGLVWYALWYWDVPGGLSLTVPCRPRAWGLAATRPPPSKRTPPAPSFCCPCPPPAAREEVTERVFGRLEVPFSGPPPPLGLLHTPQRRNTAKGFHCGKHVISELQGEYYDVSHCWSTQFWGSRPLPPPPLFSYIIAAAVAGRQPAVVHHHSYQGWRGGTPPPFQRKPGYKGYLEVEDPGLPRALVVLRHTP